METNTFRTICLGAFAIAVGMTAAVIAALLFTDGISGHSSGFMNSILPGRGDSSLEHYQSVLRFRFFHLALAGLVASAVLFAFARRSRRMTAPSMIGFLAFLPLILVTIYFASGLMVLFVSGIEYPYQWDYGEGNILDQVESLKQGIPIYTSFEDAPYTVVNYPPVYISAVVAFQALVPLSSLAVGRLLSCLCTILTAVVIARIIWRVVGRDTSRGLRTFASVSGSVVFLSVYPVWGWAPLMRVDMLAALFTSLGLLAFIEAQKSNRWLYVSVAMFVLAGYTRQSAIAAPLACFVVGLAKRPGLAVRFAAGIVGAAAGLFFVLNKLTDGYFYYHVIWANSMHEFFLDRAANRLRELFVTYPLWIGVAAAAAAFVLKYFRWGRASRNGCRNAGLHSRSGHVAGWFWPFALAVSVTVGKSGSNINYFIDLMMATSILVGTGAAKGVMWYGRPGANDSYRMAKWIIFGSMVILMFSQLSHTGNLNWEMYQHRNTLPGGPTRLAAAEVCDRIRSASGDVLSVDHTLLVLAGKRVFFETRDMKRVYDKRLFDQEPMVARIRNGEFPLIVVKRRTHEDITGAKPGRGKLTPEMLEWVKRNYMLDWSGGPYYVYVRKNN